MQESFITMPFHLSYYDYDTAKATSRAEACVLGEMLKMLRAVIRRLPRRVLAGQTACGEGCIVRVRI
jgi:hypothetical protein